MSFIQTIQYCSTIQNREYLSKTFPHDPVLLKIIIWLHGNPECIYFGIFIFFLFLFDSQKVDIPFFALETWVVLILSKEEKSWKLSSLYEDTVLAWKQKLRQNQVYGCRCQILLFNKYIYKRVIVKYYWVTIKYGTHTVNERLTMSVFIMYS